MKREAFFSFISLARDRVTIRDMGPWDRHPTVTNDAEGVVDRLVKALILLPSTRLFYYDSNGDYGEIIVREGKFAGFATATPEAAR